MGDVLEFLRQEVLVHLRSRDAIQRGLARHLARHDQARKMRAALVKAEAARQPVILVEARKARLVVLVLKTLPAEALLQLVLRLLLAEGHEVEWMVHLHAEDLLVVQLVDQDVLEREGIQTTLTELAVDIVEQQRVDAQVAAPFLGLAAALGREVRTGDDVLDLVLARELVQRREEGRVLWQILVGDARLEEGDLQILHLFPVDDLGVEIQTEAVDQLLDIAYSLVGVPTGVDVEQQRVQAHFLLGDVGRVGAVQATAQADDAVEFFAFSGAFNFICQLC